MRRLHELGRVGTAQLALDSCNNAVLRGEELLTLEEDVGELREGDRLEVRPVVEGRLSFASYNVDVGELDSLEVNERWP